MDYSLAIPHEMRKRDKGNIYQSDIKGLHFICFPVEVKISMFILALL